MGQKKPIDLSFPAKGFDEGWAYKAQPEGTSPDCLNVRPYDVIGQRLRGGQRSGLSKYCTSTVNGTNPIQRLGVIIAAIVGGDDNTQDTFTQDNGVLSDTNWYLATASYPNLVASGIQPVVSSNKIVLDNTTYPGAGSCAAIHKSAATVSKSSVSATAILVSDSASGASLEFRLIVRSPSPSFPFSYTNFVRVGVTVYSDGSGFGIQPYVGGSSFGDGSGPYGSTAMNTGVSGDWKDTDVWASGVEVKAVMDGIVIKLYLDDVLMGTQNFASYPVSNTFAGFVINKSDHASNSVTMDLFTVTNSLPISGREPTIVAVSDGSVYHGDATDFDLATDGGDILDTAVERVRMTNLFGKVYLVDGTSYYVFDNATTTVSVWTPSNGDVLPISGANTARIITTYRGRIVLAGVVGDAQNWFMSAAGDPLDWDYGATQSAIMAVAGNESVAGKCPDIITCLASASDDLMIIGGDHTLWMMRGDPASGGRIDNISNSTGIIGPDAFAYDSTGTLYFFGSGVVWRMTPDGQLTPLSRNRMDRTFGAIDATSNTVKLAWDTIRQGLHIFVTPTVEGTTQHYWWDARTNSFWIDEYPAFMNPTSVAIFDADNPSDRAILLGGWDGYIRQEDPSANDDDGTTINSRVKFGPMTPGSVHQNARISRIITVLGSDSNPVDLHVYVAQSPEQVVAATTPVWAKEITSISRYSIPRIGGNSVLFEFENDSYSAAWVTGTVYVAGDQVVVSGVPYDCDVAHTSTDSGDNDHPTPPGNTTDWTATTFRTWALESVSAVLETTGRTRHGRI